MDKPLSVGIVAPCSTVPQVEFGVGLDYLKSQGFDVTVHPQVKEHHFTYAGTDESRARAFFQYAKDAKIDVIWSARGGYGAQRLLPILDALTKQKGRPGKKLLVGYSDVTVLHEYVRTRWGWSTLHSPMPAAMSFSKLKTPVWKNILSLVNKTKIDFPASESKIKWLANRPAEPIRAKLVGGNLSLWSSLVGTAYGPTPGKNKIVFLEDIGEKLYRIDRMMLQLEQSGAFDGTAAILLGDFTDCEDEADTCLKPCTGAALKKALADPKKAARIPLRRSFTQKEGFEEIFVPIAKKLKIPLATGVKVGHGPNYFPLPLGADYEIFNNQLQLLNWDWLF